MTLILDDNLCVMKNCNGQVSALRPLSSKELSKIPGKHLN